MLPHADLLPRRSRFDFRSAVPRAGIEPALPVSETGVLPLDDLESVSRARTRGVGLEGLEPSLHRLRAECAAATLQTRFRHLARDVERVGRKGLEPSSLGLKVRCPTVERTSRDLNEYEISLVVRFSDARLLSSARARRMQRELGRRDALKIASDKNDEGHLGFPRRPFLAHVERERIRLG